MKKISTRVKTRTGRILLGLAVAAGLIAAAAGPAAAGSGNNHSEPTSTLR